MPTMSADAPVRTVFGLSASCDFPRFLSVTYTYTKKIQVPCLCAEHDSDPVVLSAVTTSIHFDTINKNNDNREKINTADGRRSINALSGVGVVSVRRRGTNPAVPGRKQSNRFYSQTAVVSKPPDQQGADGEMTLIKSDVSTCRGLLVPCRGSEKQADG